MTVKITGDMCNELEVSDIFRRIARLRDQLADLARLRHQMDEWGFNTDEITDQEEWSNNEIDRLYGLIN